MDLDKLIERLNEEATRKIMDEIEQENLEKKNREKRRQEAWISRLEACLRKYPLFRNALPETPPLDFYEHAVIDLIPIPRFGENKTILKPVPVLAIEVVRQNPTCTEWSATDLVMQTFFKTIRFQCNDEEDVINAVRMTLYYIKKEKRDAGN